MSYSIALRQNEDRSQSFLFESSLSFFKRYLDLNKRYFCSDDYTISSKITPPVGSAYQVSLPYVMNTIERNAFDAALWDSVEIVDAGYMLEE